MPRGYDSLAAYYRAHREEMELALAAGCTPAEARAELRRQAKARRAACGTHAASGATAPTANQFDSRAAAPASQGQFANWQAPWMMRE